MLHFSKLQRKRDGCLFDDFLKIIFNFKWLKYSFHCKSGCLRKNQECVSGIESANGKLKKKPVFSAYCGDEKLHPMTGPSAKGRANG